MPISELQAITVHSVLMYPPRAALAQLVAFPQAREPSLTSLNMFMFRFTSAAAAAPNTTDLFEVHRRHADRSIGTQHTKAPRERSKSRAVCFPVAPATPQCLTPTGPCSADPSRA